MISDLRSAPTVSSEPERVARKFHALWAANNIDAAMQLVAENAVYNVFVSGDLFPTGGQTVGREAIEVGLRQVRAIFKFLLYRPREFVTKGNEVRLQVEFMIRHRASGEVLSNRFRIVMRIEDGLIVHADEYHDRAKFEAFMRLFGA